MRFFLVAVASLVITSVEGYYSTYTSPVVEEEVDISPSVWFQNAEADKGVCSTDILKEVTSQMKLTSEVQVYSLFGSRMSFYDEFDTNTYFAAWYGGGLRRNLKQRKEEERELTNCDQLCASGSYLCEWLCGGGRRRVLKMTYKEGATEEEKERELTAMYSQLKHDLLMGCELVLLEYTEGKTDACSQALRSAQCFSTSF